MCGLHMSPSARALSAPQKMRKKATCVKYTLFCIKTRNSLKNDLQKLPKWVTVFWWWRPLGHLWRPSMFLTRKVHPKGSKSDPKVPKIIKDDSKSGAKVLKVPPKLTKSKP